MSAVAELPPHLLHLEVARLRSAFRTPRSALQPHERRALKPALLPLLPPDANCKVYTLNEREVIAAATINGRRVVTRSKCPAQIFTAQQWAEEVAGRFLTWRPPASVEAPHG